MVKEEGGFKLILNKISAENKFTFIPTFSALGLNANMATSNLFNIAQSTPNGYILPGSPFDYVYFDDKDSAHNDFSSDQQPGSLPFLLTNFNYKKNTAPNV